MLRHDPHQPKSVPRLEIRADRNPDHSGTRSRPCMWRAGIQEAEHQPIERDDESGAEQERRSLSAPSDTARNCSYWESLRRMTIRVPR